MIAAITGRVDYLPLQLIEYRQHGGNQIGASKPTLRDKIERVTESRTARNARLFARAQALVDRGGFAPEIATLVATKAAHEQHRQRYPAARLLRIGPVLRTALSGGYARYGRGRYDVVRDLLQPDA
jgi:chorismate mutase